LLYRCRGVVAKDDRLKEGDRRALLLEYGERIHEMFRQTASRGPDKPGAQAGTAWFLVTFPSERRGGPKLAVVLAQKAVNQGPKNALYQHVLGMAHYRAGHWEKAVEALTASLKLGKGGPEAWLFLAMAHQKRGEPDKARAWYGRAVEWMEHSPEQSGAYRALRAEAGQLIGP
jgi:tetratricopeptide (TPR) repeat protein